MLSRCVLRLIGKYLRSGDMLNGRLQATRKGFFGSLGGRTKPSRAIIFFSNDFFFKNDHFEALEPHFYAQKCTFKLPGIPKVHPFSVSKTVASTQRFLNPSPIGIGQIIHRLNIEQEPQSAIINQGISFPRFQNIIVSTKFPLRWVTNDSGTNHIEANGNKTLEQMAGCFHSRRMTAIFPVGAFSILPLVEFLPGPARYQLDGFGYHVSVTLNSDKEMDMV